MRIIGDLAAFPTTKNAGPFLLTLGEKATSSFVSGGAPMDLTRTTLEAVTPRAVRVAATSHVKAPAGTLEIEGARRAGSRTPTTIARARDPILISQVDVSDAGTCPSPPP